MEKKAPKQETTETVQSLAHEISNVMDACCIHHYFSKSLSNHPNGLPLFEGEGEGEGWKE
jgi:hypothetical protein